jgi:hypothetical protein
VLFQLHVEIKRRNIYSTKENVERVATDLKGVFMGR